MTFDKDALLAALRLRYDYFSAQSVFDIVRQRAGLDDKPSFDEADLRAFRAALALHGDRTDRVGAHLDELLGGAPAAPASEDAPAKPAAAEPAKPAKGGKAAKAEPAAAKAAEPAPVEAKPAEAAPATPAESIETTISLKGLEVTDGEQVLICGAGEEIGDWDPEKARPLAREGELWMTTIKVAPDAEVSFKFLRRDADGKIVWETGDNRSVTAAEPLDATWR